MPQGNETKLEKNRAMNMICSIQWAKIAGISKWITTIWQLQTSYSDSNKRDLIVLTICDLAYLAWCGVFLTEFYIATASATKKSTKSAFYFRSAPISSNFYYVNKITRKLPTGIKNERFNYINRIKIDFYTFCKYCRRNLNNLIANHFVEFHAFFR